MTEDTIDPAVADANRAAARALARALFRVKVTLPVTPVEGEDEAVAADAPDKDEWTEKRKDYQKVAKQMMKRLDKQGFALVATEKAAEEAEDDDDEE